MLFRSKVRLTFELLNPRTNVKEIEVNGQKIQIADRISFDLNKSMSDKSSFHKLFEKMRRGRQDIKHMAQMLNEGFVITVVHNTVVDKTDPTKTKVYANITDSDGSYLVAAPVHEDPLSGEQTAIPVPEAISPVRIFLFEKPTPASWATLFIDGDKTVKDKDGTEKTVSKNWLQDRVKSATDFKGSALDLMLQGGDKLPDVTAPKSVDAPALKVVESAPVPSSPEVAPSAVSASPSEDPLAKFGLSK